MLGVVIQRFGLGYHQYIDASQLYLMVLPDLRRVMETLNLVPGGSLETNEG